MTLEELKKLYGEKGATEQRVTPSEQGDIVDYIPVQLGDGWTAFENDNRKIIDYIGSGMDATPVYDDAPKTLGGFSKQEGDYITDYDLNGNPIARRKWNESALKTMWNDLGPIAMAALTFGGGAGALGNSLFGLTGNAAAGAGGALAGGVNAAATGQNILQGALKGGVGSAGGVELGNTGLTLGNVNSAANAIKNKDLLGLLSSGAGAFDTSGINIGGLNAKDIAKYAGLAKDALSGTDAGLFKAITGLAGDKNLANAFGPGDMKQFDQDLISGYFLPGGEGYVPSKLNQTYGPEEPFDPSKIDWASLYADTSNGSPAGKNVADFANQNFGVDPNANFDSYMNTMNQISNNGGFGSQWQTLGTNRVLINDDGGATVLDPTTQETSFLTQEQVDALVKNGSLNSDASGYVKATGGKDGVPGGSGTKTVTPDKKTETETKKMMQNLGLNYVQAPSQDPFADIKSMEDIFGPDIAYKLRSLKGSDTAKKPASNNMDALAKLLRG